MKNKKLPPIIGDGITDDTEAIQARLDAGIPIIIKKGKIVLISRPLRIPPNYEIKLSEELQKILDTI